MMASGKAAAEGAEKTKPPELPDWSHPVLCHRPVAEASALHSVERQGPCCQMMLSPASSSLETATAGPTGAYLQWSAPERQAPNVLQRSGHLMVPVPRLSMALLTVSSTPDHQLVSRGWSSKGAQRER